MVSIIDAATNAVMMTLPVGLNPEGVAFSPNGQQVFIPTLAGSVSVIDAATRTVLSSIPSGAGSRIISFTPNGLTAFVSNNLGGTISVLAIDYSLPTITGTPPVGTVGTAYS